jgi:hypothetical protein
MGGEGGRIGAEVTPHRLRLPPLLKFVLAVVVVVIGILGVASRATSLSAGDLARNEFTQDYVSARAARTGADPYGETYPLVQRYLGRDASSYELPRFAARNPHPPTQVLLVRPFSLAGYRLARLLWLAAMAGCFAIAIGLLARELGLRPIGCAVVGIGALGIPVIQKDLLYGQVNAVLLLAMVVGWIALRREKFALAGASIGIATAVKLFPLFLVIPLFRRSKRAAVWQLGSAAVLIFTSAAVLGLGSSNRFFTVSSPENFRFWRAAPVSISLVGLPFRWLAANPWSHTSVNSVSLAWVVAAMIGAACVFGAFKTQARFSGDVFWSAVPWMILSTPLAWESYLSLAVPFAMLIVVASFRRDRLPHPLMMAALALMLIGVPPGLPGSSHGIGLVAQLLGYALPTWGLLAAGILDIGDAGLRSPSQGRDFDLAEAPE